MSEKSKEPIKCDIPMRILLFTQQLAGFRSGIGTYAFGLTTGLAARGHLVTVVIPEGEGLKLPGVRLITVPRPRFDATPGGWLSLGLSFAKVLAVKAAEHDIAHFTDAREAWRVYRLTIPVVGMVNDSYALDWLERGYPRRSFKDRKLRNLYYRLLRFVEKRTYHRLNALIANSRHVARAVITGYRLNSRKVNIIYYGLPDCPAFSPVPMKCKPAILFVGANFQRKGLPTLLKAAARLRPRYNGLCIHVVGRDRNQPALESLARKLDITSDVVFHGWQPNDRVRGMMAGADVFALPSLTEAFGLVYLEAMRAGTPVVATTLGGAREVFREGEEALFVAPGDVDGLAEAIEKIITDPKTTSRLQGGGRAAVSRFSVEAMAAATEELYSHIL